MVSQIFRSSIDAIDEIDFVRAQLAQLSRCIRENKRADALRLCADSLNRLEDLLEAVERVKG